MHNRLLLIILIISLIIGASTLTRGQDWGDDFASYIMQAESIWKGTTHEFVEQNSFTIFQSSNLIGPVAYPWGYPLILAPVYAIKGVSPLALKLPTLLFFVGFLICLYFFMKTRLTETESLLIVCLFAFNPLLLRFLDAILSDIPFLFFIMLSLLAISYVETKEGLRNDILLGLLFFLAFFMRTTGIILLVSLLIYQSIRFFRKHTNRNDIMLSSSRSLLVFGICWLITSRIFPDEQGSYFEQLRGLTFMFFKASIYFYFYLFANFFGEGIIWIRLYYGLVIFFLVGISIRARFSPDQYLLIFFILYFVSVLLWPFWQGPRFIFPLLPIFIYFTFQGMKFFFEKLLVRYSPIGRRMVYGFWSFIAIIFLFNSTISAYNNIKNNRTINGPFDPYSKQVYQYINKKTPVDSVVIFFKPRVMRLMTDRPSIMSTECDRMLKGDYLVLSKKVGENQQIPPERINSCNLPLTRVLSNNRFIVYEIQK
jgi:4-amino-4-deoxy-L-arabinose transferase-like glycosyltransferase